MAVMSCNVTVLSSCSIVQVYVPW